MAKTAKDITRDNLFFYDIKGITLSSSEMYDIYHYFDLMCIIEVIMDNYDIPFDKAVECGYEVKAMLDRDREHDDPEADVVGSVMDELGYNHI